MNIFLLKKYIKNLNQETLYNLSAKQNIFLDNDELPKAFNYIKENESKYFDNKISKEKILNDSKNILTATNYNKLLKLYDKYKDKI